jgi:hypothetical protein
VRELGVCVCVCVCVCRCVCGAVVLSRTQLSLQTGQMWVPTWALAMAEDLLWRWMAMALAMALALASLWPAASPGI